MTLLLLSHYLMISFLLLIVVYIVINNNRLLRAHTPVRLTTLNVEPEIKLPIPRFGPAMIPMGSYVTYTNIRPVKQRGVHFWNPSWSR